MQPPTYSDVVKDNIYPHQLKDVDRILFIYLEDVYIKFVTKKAKMSQNLLQKVDEFDVEDFDFDLLQTNDDFTSCEIPSKDEDKVSYVLKTRLETDQEREDRKFLTFDGSNTQQAKIASFISVLRKDNLSLKAKVDTLEHNLNISKNIDSIFRLKTAIEYGTVDEVKYLAENYTYSEEVIFDILENTDIKIPRRPKEPNPILGRNVLDSKESALRKIEKIYTIKKYGNNGDSITKWITNMKKYIHSRKGTHPFYGYLINRNKGTWMYDRKLTCLLLFLIDDYGKVIIQIEDQSMVVPYVGESSSFSIALLSNTPLGGDIIKNFFYFTHTPTPLIEYDSAVYFDEFRIKETPIEQVINKVYEQYFFHKNNKDVLPVWVREIFGRRTNYFNGREINDSLTPTLEYLYEMLFFINN